MSSNNTKQTLLYNLLIPVHHLEPDSCTRCRRTSSPLGSCAGACAGSSSAGAGSCKSSRRRGSCTGNHWHGSLFDTAPFWRENNSLIFFSLLLFTFYAQEQTNNQSEAAELKRAKKGWYIDQPLNIEERLQIALGQLNWLNSESWEFTTLPFWLFLKPAICPASIVRILLEHGSLEALEMVMTLDSDSLFKNLQKKLRVMNLWLSIPYKSFSTIHHSQITFNCHFFIGQTWYLCFITVGRLSTSSLSLAFPSLL